MEENSEVLFNVSIRRGGSGPVAHRYCPVVMADSAEPLN
jgi:hypothetical protein